MGDGGTLRVRLGALVLYEASDPLVTTTVTGLHEEPLEWCPADLYMDGSAWTVPGPRGSEGVGVGDLGLTLGAGVVGGVTVGLDAGLDGRTVREPIHAHTTQHHHAHHTHHQQSQQHGRVGGRDGWQGCMNGLIQG